jgi:hypothetical protein
MLVSLPSYFIPHITTNKSDTTLQHGSKCLVAHVVKKRTPRFLALNTEICFFFKFKAKEYPFKCI